MSKSWSLDCGGLTVADQSAQWKRGLAVVCPEPLFFQPPLIRSRDSHLATREYFSVFLYCMSYLFCFLVIWYSWNIVSCLVITVYLCYYCWNVYYHCAFVLCFLHVLILSVYMLGYFHPAYIRHSNVSVPTGIGRYRMVSKLRLSHLQYN